MTLTGLIMILAAAAGLVYTGNRRYRASNSLVLGSGRLAQCLMQDSEACGPGRRLNVLGHICTQDCGCALPQSNCRDTTPNLLKILREKNASTILIAASKEEIESYSQQLLDCKLQGIKLVDAAMVSSHTERMANSIKIERALSL